jgi:hypothetical protein
MCDCGVTAIGEKVSKDLFPSTLPRMDPKREAYPFAGALCVAAGDLLARIHEVAGPPPVGSADELDEDRRALAAAAAAGYGAAAACAALSGRLLLMARDATREQLPRVRISRRFELGVTVLEATETRAWRSTVRAAAAARDEVEICREVWSADEFDDASDVLGAVGRLASYIDELTLVLERIEPAEQAT